MVKDSSKKKSAKSSVTKKSWKKPFSCKQGSSMSKTNQPHIVEYFFSSQTDLAIFMLTDPTSPSKDSFNYRVGELIEQDDDIREFFYCTKPAGKEWNLKYNPPTKNRDKYYRRAFIFIVPPTENSLLS